MFSLVVYYKWITMCQCTLYAAAAVYTPKTEYIEADNHMNEKREYFILYSFDCCTIIFLYLLNSGICSYYVLFNVGNYCIVSCSMFENYFMFLRSQMAFTPYGVFTGKTSEFKTTIHCEYNCTFLLWVILTEMLHT